VWWKRVKGELEVSFLIETHNVRAQPQVEAEISELAVLSYRV
jgi:hypothetical protein